MNRDLNIKSTIRQILGVLISIMILMPFTVSSQTVHNHHRLRKRYNRHKRQRISLGPQQQDTGS